MGSLLLIFGFTSILAGLFFLLDLLIPGTNVPGVAGAVLWCGGWLMMGLAAALDRLAAIRKLLEKP